jgi:hypothetical protein
MPSSPTVVTRGEASGTIDSTVAVAVFWFAIGSSSRLAISETWNSDPPRNSMPNTKPPRRAGPTIEATIITAAMMYQMRRLPTKLNDRSPV